MEIETTIIKNEEIKGTLEFESFIMRLTRGKMSGIIRFSVSNKSGNNLGATVIPNKILIVIIPPEEWSDFWAKFNNGKYLVETFKNKYNLKDLVIPDSVENWFTNPI